MIQPEFVLQSLQASLQVDLPRQQRLGSVPHDMRQDTYVFCFADLSNYFPCVIHDVV